MYLTERELRSKINSEIHTSLQRLEDADYVNSIIQERKTIALADHVDAVDERLTKELYQLHDYIAPHIRNGDLKYFSKLVAGTITMNNADYSPHAITVDGTVQTASILSTGDLSFSWAGLVEGSWSGDNYTVRSKNSGTTLVSAAVTPHVEIVYDSVAHEYKISPYVTDEKGIKHPSKGPYPTGTQAYQDGKDEGSYPPNSAVLEWFETVGGVPHFKKTSGDSIGEDPKTVYFDD